MEQSLGAAQDTAAPTGKDPSVVYEAIAARLRGEGFDRAQAEAVLAVHVRLIMDVMRQTGAFTESVTG